MTNATKQRSILIVEDDQAIATALTELLEHHGYTVLIAVDGPSGLRMARLRMPSLILLDLMLPGLSGQDMLQRLRRDARTSHIPVVIITAMGGESTHIDQLERGADYYISKPYLARELLAVIRRLLSVHASLEARGFLRPSPPAPISTREDFLMRLKDWVEQNHNDPSVTVAKAARALGYSESDLQRRIKKWTGMSFKRFLHKWRLEFADRLINAGVVNMTEVSFRAGFRSPSHFTQCFKKQFDITPKRQALRRRMRGASQEPPAPN